MFTGRRITLGRYKWEFDSEGYRLFQLQSPDLATELDQIVLKFIDRCQRLMKKKPPTKNLDPPPSFVEAQLSHHEPLRHYQSNPETSDSLIPVSKENGSEKGSVSDLTTEPKSPVQRFLNYASHHFHHHHHHHHQHQDHEDHKPDQNHSDYIQTFHHGFSSSEYANHAKDDKIVTINIAGNRYQTFLDTLEKFPNSLLGNYEKRLPFLNPATNEYFFDRHRGSFESILYFYQSEGYLRRPGSVPVDIFVEELMFFDLGDEVIEKFWTAEGYKKPVEPNLPTNPIKRKIWLLLEHPDSSVGARICAFLSIFVIVLSTLSFCLETLPVFHEDRISNATAAATDESFQSTKHRSLSSGESVAAAVVLEGSPSVNRTFADAIQPTLQNPFFIIELICILWFTTEFCLRFFSTPSYREFLRSFLNWVDFLAIAPFFINLAFRNDNSAGMSFAVLRVLRLVRVFRIFKLSRHSRGLQILGMTFKASVREFCLLCFFLALAVILFSSAIYFAEYNQKDSDFTSIPTAFWYAIVTMTTIGYGDLVPKGPLGKLVGSVCAIVGVLVIALPVPVIVENFKHFYRQENKIAKVNLLMASRSATGQQQKKIQLHRSQSNMSADS